MALGRTDASLLHSTLRVPRTFTLTGLYQSAKRGCVQASKRVLLCVGTACYGF